MCPAGINPNIASSQQSLYCESDVLWNSVSGKNVDPFPTHHSVPIPRICKTTRIEKAHIWRYPYFYEADRHFDYKITHLHTPFSFVKWNSFVICPWPDVSFLKVWEVLSGLAAWQIFCDLSQSLHVEERGFLSQLYPASILITTPGAPRVDTTAFNNQRNNMDKNLFPSAKSVYL